MVLLVRIYVRSDIRSRRVRDVDTGGLRKEAGGLRNGSAERLVSQGSFAICVDFFVKVPLFRKILANSISYDKISILRYFSLH